jgi:hypothetical protein
VSLFVESAGLNCLPGYHPVITRALFALFRYGSHNNGHDGAVNLCSCGQVEEGEHQDSDADSGEDDEMDLDSDLGLQVSGPAVALTMRAHSA